MTTTGKRILTGMVAAAALAMAGGVRYSEYN